MRKKNRKYLVAICNNFSAITIDRWPSFEARKSKNSLAQFFTFVRHVRECKISTSAEATIKRTSTDVTCRFYQSLSVSFANRFFIKSIEIVKCITREPQTAHLKANAKKKIFFCSLLEQKKKIALLSTACALSRASHSFRFIPPYCQHLC